MAIRIGSAYQGGPFGVSLGAQRKYWQQLPRWRNPTGRKLGIVGQLGMRTAEALAVLTSLRPHDPEIVSELGERGDAAYLHLALTSGSGHWAVVSSPGDRWFSMEVDGGFSLDHFEEGTPDEDMTRILRQYTEIALEYLHRRPRAQRRGVLRMLAITVSTTQGDIVLRRSVTATLKSLAGSRSQR